ncbi:MAG: acetyl-CoA carboxylase biotin carboxyl carrier protein subunit [candidate division Zixibacteria bacterium]|nr:acetyl-CoA carboxylase biotin carboxyl carrier protein subunit [candidate division Zixibacteria bacterium]
MSASDFVFGEDIVSAACEKVGDRLLVKVGEKEYLFQPIGENLFSTNVNGAACIIGVVEDGGTYFVDIDSVLLEVTEPSEDGFAGGAGGLAGEKDKVFAPMPGKIVKVLVGVGDEVALRQSMAIVEAMKMENVIVSRAAGRVKAVNFAPGDQVDTESPIIELELDE